MKPLKGKDAKIFLEAMKKTKQGLNRIPDEEIERMKKNYEKIKEGNMVEFIKLNGSYFKTQEISYVSEFKENVEINWCEFTITCDTVDYTISKKGIEELRKEYNELLELL